MTSWYPQTHLFVYKSGQMFLYNFLLSSIISQSLSLIFHNMHNKPVMFMTITLLIYSRARLLLEVITTWDDSHLAAILFIWQAYHIPYSGPFRLSEDIPYNSHILISVPRQRGQSQETLTSLSFTHHGVYKCLCNYSHFLIELPIV